MNWTATLEQLRDVFSPKETATDAYAWLALLMEHDQHAGAEVFAHFKAMYLHARGMPPNDSLRDLDIAAAVQQLRNFTDVSIVVSAEGEERNAASKFYKKAGLRVLFDAREVSTNWVLYIDAHRLPTPSLLRFVDEAVLYSDDYVWGFPQVHCRYDAITSDLQVSQFRQLGPLRATNGWTWCLRSRKGGQQEKAASADALLLNFEWVAQSFVQLLERCSTEAGASTQPFLSPHVLSEAIPRSWHMFESIQSEPYREFARRIYSLREGGRLPKFDALARLFPRPLAEMPGTIPVQGDAAIEPRSGAHGDGWIAQRMVFSATVFRRASGFVVDAYVPKQLPSGTLVKVFAESEPIVSTTVQPDTTLRIACPYPMEAGQTATFSIVASDWFVPIQSGINPDNRPLTLRDVRVSFEHPEGSPVLT